MMNVRALACLILLPVAAILLLCGSAYHYKEVLPDDPNDVTVVRASEFGLNRAVAAGRLFRDPAGTLRTKTAESCST